MGPLRQAVVWKSFGNLHWAARHGAWRGIANLRSCAEPLARDAHWKCAVRHGRQLVVGTEPLARGCALEVRGPAWRGASYFVSLRSIALAGGSRLTPGLTCFDIIASICVL